MDDELIAAAELGDEAKRFVESDLGRCILGIAEQEKLIALERLADISPTDTEGIMELQNSYKRYENFGQWLIELISKGENAIGAWKHGQTDE